MREFATKVDNVGNTLGATGFNAYIAELENIAKNAGFTLDPEIGPDTDLNMLGKSAAIYSSAGWRYDDSGSANTYVLSRVASSVLQNVSEYYDGMAISFIAGATNTGASTANVATLGAKALVLRGAALTGNEVIAGEQILAFYEKGNDRFELVPLFGTIIDGTVTFPKLSDSVTEADNAKKRVSKAWVNFNGTGVVAIRDSINVSSITDNGVGDYTVNFTTNMADTDYSANLSVGSGLAAGAFSNNCPAAAPLVSSVRLETGGATGAALDPAYVNVNIFGN